MQKLSVQTMRYPPNTQKREHIRYTMADTCPFRQESYLDEIYIIKPVKERYKHDILRDLIYQDKVKDVTKRVTQSTISSARKAQLAHLPLNSQDDNRVKLFKMHRDDPAVPRHIPGMYTNLGSLRHTGMSGQIYGQPAIASCNKEFYLGRSSGGPASKSLGVEMYNKATPLCANWKTIQSLRSSNKRTEESLFKSRRPTSLSRYSIHKPPRVEAARVQHLHVMSVKQ